jgi:hypothetical protein
VKKRKEYDANKARVPKRVIATTTPKGCKNT